MNRLLSIMALSVLLGTATAQTPGPEPEGPGSEPEAPGTPDDDPVVYWYEEVAPAIEAGDEDWTPLYERYEDPASLDCGGRSHCQAHKDNWTVDPK